MYCQKIFSLQVHLYTLYTAHTVCIVGLLYAEHYYMIRNMCDRPQVQYTSKLISPTCEGPTRGPACKMNILAYREYSYSTVKNTGESRVTTHMRVAWSFNPIHILRYQCALIRVHTYMYMCDTCGCRCQSIADGGRTVCA